MELKNYVEQASQLGVPVRVSSEGEDAVEDLYDQLQQASNHVSRYDDETRQHIGEIAEELAEQYNQGQGL